MTDQTIVEVGHVEPTAEETAAALAAAAAKAPKTQEEAAALIAAEEAAKNAPERPKGLPEKFKSWEDMAASYAELEKKVGAPAEEAGAEDDVKDEDLKPEELEVKDDGKVDLTTFDAEYAENGTLSEESYAALEAKGFNKATVDGYIAGQEALAQIATQRITEAAGGKESMDAMFAWATTALPAADIDTFNEQFQYSDPNTAVMAMEKLKGQYEAANGKDPKLVGGKPSGSSVDVFTSWTEVSTAMSNPLYQTDHAYRTKIEQKLSRSNPR